MDKHPRRLAGLAFGNTLLQLQHLQPTTPRESLPGFELEFWSDGKPFRAFVRARNVQAATAEALIELAYKCADFNHEGARLIASKEVR